MKTFISIIFLIISVSLFSQNANMDSLQQKLNHAKGHERILALNDLANEYGYIDFNKSISLANEALKLAVIQKCNDTKARSYNIIGIAYYVSNNFKIADEYYNKGISAAERYKTPDDIYKALRLKMFLYLNGYIKDSVEAKTVFKKYINWAFEKNKFNDFAESLKMYSYVYSLQQTALSEMIDYLVDLEERTKDNLEFLSAIYAGEAYIYNQNIKYFNAIQKYEQAIKLTKDIYSKISHIERIGNIYYEIRKYKEAIQYYNDALVLTNTHNFEFQKSMRYLLEADLGESYLLLKDYKMALYNLKKALESPYFINRDKGTILSNIGVAYLSMDSLDKADYYLAKAFVISDSFKINKDKLAFLNSKAELMKRRKQWTQLSNVIADISQLATEVKDYYVVYDSYELLSDYYEKSGNFKKSNEYLKKWITVNDSINNRELVNKMSEFRFKYETEKKEQQIIMQQSIIRQKDELIVLSFIGGSLILAALLVIFILYRIRNKAYKLLVSIPIQYLMKPLKRTLVLPLIFTRKRLRNYWMFRISNKFDSLDSVTFRMGNSIIRSVPRSGLI